MYLILVIVAKPVLEPVWSLYRYTEVEQLTTSEIYLSEIYSNIIE